MGTIRDSIDMVSNMEVPMHDHPRLPAKVLIDDIEKLVVTGNGWWGDSYYPCSYSFSPFPMSHYTDEKG